MRPGRPVLPAVARWGVQAAPALVFVALGMLRLAPVWSSPTTRAQCGCSDPAFTMWYLGWTQFALAHRINPFFTDWMFHPSGVNTLWNVSLPLPGALLAPLTDRWGVVLSYNVLIVVAFAGTALSAYLVLRRWAPWRPAAFAGGLLYGFSPYMIGQGLGHAHMVLLLLVPVLLLLLDEILVRQAWPPWICGPLLGVTAVAQLFVAEEVLASAALVGLLGAVAVAALFPRAVRPRLPRAAAGLGFAAATGLLLGALPLLHQLTGPQRLTGTVNRPDRYRADLLSWVVPSRLVRFAPESSLRTSDHFVGNLAENGSYLGVPLLVVAAGVTVLLWRRRPMVRWAAVMLVVVMVLACGPALRVDGRETGLTLPFRWLEHLPLLESLVSVRLASYAVLFCALLLALGMAELHARPPAGPRLGRVLRRQPAGAVWAVAVALVALLPLLPGQLRYSGENAGIPLWYRSAAVEQRVPEGSVLVTVPPASPANAAPMIWQAAADYRFTVPFGYSLHPGPDGRGQFGPYPSRLEILMARIRRGPPPRANAEDISRMRAELLGWAARTIVVNTETNANVPQQVDLLTRVVGRPPARDFGAWVWYDVDPAELGRLPVVPPPWPPRPVSLPPG